MGAASCSLAGVGGGVRFYTVILIPVSLRLSSNAGTSGPTLTISWLRLTGKMVTVTRIVVLFLLGAQPPDNPVAIGDPMASDPPAQVGLAAFFCRMQAGRALGEEV